VGRITAVLALATAMLTAKPLLGSFDQVFQAIQEYTGFVTPGIVVIFLLGMFWSRATTAGAFVATVGSVVMSFAYKLYAPQIPFMNRVGYVFLLCLAAAVAVSLLQPKPKTSTVDLTEIDYSTSASFNVAGVIVIGILIALYSAFW
jgi:SSS family solute:Na+ symporter